MPGSICHFHADDWATGVHVGDGVYSYTCDRSMGHPQHGPWTWVVFPTPSVAAGIAGLAEELGLTIELPAALASLGTGWFEYGLVERAYARRQPAAFAQMVERWSHTALNQDLQYSVSAYLGRTLGALSSHGDVAYHPGEGTGRWAYNSDISCGAPSRPGTGKSARRGWTCYKTRA
jgi:hypothetical protein